MSTAGRAPRAPPPAVIGRTAYGAPKAGPGLLTKVMAVEPAEAGYPLNAIAPGPVATDVERAMHNPETVEAYKFLVPQRHYGGPQRSPGRQFSSRPARTVTSRATRSISMADCRPPD
jgi:NAD(P)-dependent dehydrogenase (short-subunit alcohol dehydrogenase family)